MNYSRIRAIGPWLAEAWHVGVAVAVIAIALAVAASVPTEPVIRITGLVLQLFGISSVIWGISETRALFGHPSIASKTKAWFGRFPPIRRYAPVPGDGLSVSASIISGRMHSVHTPDPNATVEARVATLELNIDAIHTRISHNEADVDREFRNTADQLRQEQHAREAEDSAMHNKLEATGTGGVHISAIGASWLFVGVVLSSASPEIAAWVK
jgi:hypothetical protein